MALKRIDKDINQCLVQGAPALIIQWIQELLFNKLDLQINIHKVFREYETIMIECNGFHFSNQSIS